MANYSSNSNFLENLKKIFTLLMNDLRLTATEKLSRLLTTFTIAFIIGLLGLGILLFLSYSFAAFLSNVMSQGFACLIVAGAYLVLIIVTVIFRKPLIEDPVTRLLSRIILSAPVNRNESLTHKSKEQNEE